MPPRRRASQTPAPPAPVPVLPTAVGAAAGGATGAAAGAAAVLATTGAASEVVDNAVKAVRATLQRTRFLRDTRIWERLGRVGIPVEDVEKVLRQEKEREKLYQDRAEKRVRLGLQTALRAEDPSARAAAVQAVFRRERVYARQRAQSSAERLVAAGEKEGLKRESPAGAFWMLGTAVEHTPECLMMAGKFWPWEVLDLLPFPLHPNCPCWLIGMGAALSGGYLRPDEIRNPAVARRLAQPVIDFVNREQADAEAALRELELREELSRTGRGNRDLLAALPLATDPWAIREDANPTGVMVALYPDAETAVNLAVRGGESPDALHVTLAFLGDQAELGDGGREALVAAVRRWAEETPPLEGEISGVGTFVSGPKPVTYLSVDLAALPHRREELVQALDRAGVPPRRDHGFTPHLTLDYEKRRPRIDRPVPLRFSHVCAVWGEERIELPLQGPRAEERESPPELEESWIDVSSYRRKDGTRVDSYRRLVHGLMRLADPADPVQGLKLGDGSRVRRDTVDEPGMLGKARQALTGQKKQEVNRFQTRRFVRTTPGGEEKHYETPQDLAADLPAVDKPTPTGDSPAARAVELHKDRILKEWKDRAETAVEEMGPKDTDTRGFWTEGEGWSPERLELHRTIVVSFLGRSVGDPPVAPEIHFTGGGTASGKSTMAKEELGSDLPTDAVHVDADAIKSMLPEYQLMTAAGRTDAAARAHAESNHVKKLVIDAALAERRHIVVDGTLSKPENVKVVRSFRAAGYDTSVHLATTPTDLAVERATVRGERTGRVVPEDYIHASHKGVSATFAELVSSGAQVRLYDTSEKQPQLIAFARDGKVIVMNRRIYQAFLDKAKV